MITEFADLHAEITTRNIKEMRRLLYSQEICFQISEPRNSLLSLTPCKFLMHAKL